MASGILKMLLADFKTDDMWKPVTERAAIAKESATYLLQSAIDNEVAFDKFADDLEVHLKKVVASVSGINPHSKSFTDKLWGSFHQSRIKELPVIWGSFSDAINIPERYNDPLLLQHCSTKFLEIIVKGQFPSGTRNTPTVPIPLTDDEENALRYVAGFVVRTLMKKTVKRSSLENTAKIIACLSDLTSEDSECDCEDYLSYTKEWIYKINRGGLYVISDDVYLVFKSMEIITRQILRSIDRSKSTEDSVGKKRAICTITTDDDVKFYWSLVTAGTPNDISELVLEMIAELFLTVRGFAAAAMYVEEYKRVKQTTLNGTKALRKELKRKHDNSV